MAQNYDNLADNVVTNFDLQNFFDSNETEMTQLDETHVEDSAFVELMQNVASTSSKTDKTKEVPTAAEGYPVCFPVLTKHDIDEIASNVVKPKTKKQTIWGIRVI